MHEIDSAWQARVDALWERVDDYSPEDFIAEMDRTVAIDAADVPSAVVEFERGGARDSVGRTEEAVELYREALALTDPALDTWRARQATIQLASSLRALGRADEAVRLLEAEVARPLDADDPAADEAAELQGAVNGFLALALADAGREREAVGIAVGTLAGHLTRYRRSLTDYADSLR